MSLKFGTDGIRGVANTELTTELSLALGQAAVRVFQDKTFLVGRDTRLSGPAISAALSAGLASEGANVIDVGVLPTPALAHLSATLGHAAAMISASHNPFGDNGIKFFLAGGHKLSDQIETRLEAELGRSEAAQRPAGPAVGSLHQDTDAKDAYIDHLRQSLQGEDLNGLRVVLDCANGAANTVARAVFTAAGAEVLVINDCPNGTNINDGCGSTHPEGLQAAVVASGFDIGLAFDGDADRVLAVDHTGALVDGDHVLGMLAIDAKQQGQLQDNTLVVTVMSNLGLRLGMEANDIAVHVTDVGDRYVLEALNEHGWSLGGEQSGHIIFPAHATTGDGLLTGLRILALMHHSKQSLQELATQTMTRLPQVLKNVRVRNRDALESAKAVWDEVAAVEAELGHVGRVLLRPSGTEPLVRVMIEAPTLDVATTVCDRLCAMVERELSA